GGRLRGRRCGWRRRWCLRPALTRSPGDLAQAGDNGLAGRDLLGEARRHRLSSVQSPAKRLLAYLDGCLETADCPFRRLGRRDQLRDRGLEGLFISLQAREAPVEDDTVSDRDDQ